MTTKDLTIDYLDSEELSKFQVNLCDYESYGCIGYGKNGPSYIVLHKKTKKIFALKQIDNFNEVDFVREVLFMSRLRHPAILRFAGFTKETDTKPATIITEFIPHGDLKWQIQKFREAEDEIDNFDTIRYKIVYGIASALKKCHAENIMHRDLKPDNILLDDNLEPYLADFGLSKNQEGIEVLKQSRIIGSPTYMAPEMLGQEASFSSDVYSFGVILYELCTLLEPWAGQNIINIGASVSSGLRPDIPEELENHENQLGLIKKCWAQSPPDRIPFCDIIKAFDEDIINDQSAFFEKADMEAMREYAERISSGNPANVAINSFDRVLDEDQTLFTPENENDEADMQKDSSAEMELEGLKLKEI